MVIKVIIFIYLRDEVTDDMEVVGRVWSWRGV
jgi:hypothetical protein